MKAATKKPEINKGAGEIKLLEGDGDGEETGLASDPLSS